MVQQVKGLKVLDLGCWDETALVKKGNHFWMHEEISRHAAHTLGIDNSPTLPEEGAVLDRSRVIKGDITQKAVLAGHDIDVILAGELIEHLPDTSQFLALLKAAYPGKRLLLSTPNATNLSNCLLALFQRESNHRDHLQIYSFKTLNTLCHRAGFASYRIVPYHVKFTEMALRQTRALQKVVHILEWLVNLCEKLFPMVSGGYIVEIVL
jgi:SAM-dependent methyltransferase